MTQKRTEGKRRAPTYSADTLALRFLAGLALIALGVVIFLAVILQMQGQIFTGLREISFGLCGGAAYLIPILPVWAGILMIWSTQRRAPVMPWVYAFLAMIFFCAFLVLITHTATAGYLTYVKNAYGSLSPGSEWGEAIHGAYRDGAAHHWSGGAVGVIFAWPLDRFLGSFLGGVLTFAATAFLLLMSLNLTPARIRAIVTGQAGRLREQQRAERQQNEAQQMAWQQEQARQREMWEAQQRQMIAQQQSAQVARQQGAQSAQPGPARPAAMPGSPAQTARQVAAGRAASESSVAAWQQQMEMQQVTDQNHVSRIFGRKQEAEAQPKPDRGWKSRIFSRKPQEEDGLTDPEAVKAASGAQVRRTATGERITRPETRWTAPEEQSPARTPRPAEAPAPRQPAEDVRAQALKEEAQREAREEQAQREALEQARRRKAEEAAAEPVREEPRAAERPEAPAEMPEPRREMPARRQKGSGEQAETEKQPSPWSRQVQAALSAQQNPAGPEPEPASAPREPAQQVMQVPRAQMRIGQEAYQPELKLPPREKPEAGEEEVWTPRPYIYPPITDLKLPEENHENTEAEDAMRSRRLEETLASFKLQARVVNVTHGPAISRFELELAAGTRVNKVAELEKDIAYGMEATSVRIEAPIPGKSLVGVEVPNRKVAKVTLREVLESEKMQSARSVLTVALGKDIAGTPIICDLAKMPHMLIAGQTGSGKSVCVNAIINSLLYRAGPDEVKLILVDPKVVELQCYNGIPHLLIPVVNDPHKAAAALAWAVAEMMERYDKFAERKVRNLDGYNSVIGPGEKPMARIVIIIDELADLMMVCKKDVEEYICRLTQLARAAGIHLIVATQRPSVDVITGLIKANIPSRIAFKTASSVDSRTILDRNGSEQLLGWGDMLYLPTGSFAPTRVQGCFLSDEEVNRIAAHVREANPATYDPDILEKLDQLAGGSAGDLSGADMVAGTGEVGGVDGGLFEQAVEFAIADGQISTSTLQRRLKIGYARAGRLTDEMEERGIVAAKDGSKPRKCLITREEWEEMKKSTEGMV